VLIGITGKVLYSTEEQRERFSSKSSLHDIRDEDEIFYKLHQCILSYRQ
jgi:hypothetical protein